MMNYSSRLKKLEGQADIGVKHAVWRVFQGGELVSESPVDGNRDVEIHFMPLEPPKEKPRTLIIVFEIPRPQAFTDLDLLQP